jgi:hypothetical protein
MGLDSGADPSLNHLLLPFFFFFGGILAFPSGRRAILSVQVWKTRQFAFQLSNPLGLPPGGFFV